MKRRDFRKDAYQYAEQCKCKINNVIMSDSGSFTLITESGEFYFQNWRDATMYFSGYCDGRCARADSNKE